MLPMRIKELVMSDLEICLIGATGALGSAIVDALIRQDVRMHALVRPSKEEGKTKVYTALRDRGVELIEGALGDPVEKLAGHLSGFDVIISAVAGSNEVVRDGQINLVRAAERAGVRRMIPSDYTINIFDLDYGDNDASDPRKKVHEAFEGSTVRPTSVLCGWYTEYMTTPFLEIVDWDAGTFSYWGDGDRPGEFTTISDVARYTVAAALDNEVAGRSVRVAGDRLTMLEFHRVVERASGRSLRLRRLGSIDDLWTEIQRRRATAQGMFEYVGLQYQWAVLSGKAKLAALDNDRYPEILPVNAETGIRAALKRASDPLTS